MVVLGARPGVVVGAASVVLLVVVVVVVVVQAAARSATTSTRAVRRVGRQEADMRAKMVHLVKA
jgi:hypothetical protein